MNTKIILPALSLSISLFFGSFAAEEHQVASEKRISFATADFTDESKRQLITLELLNKSSVSTQLIIEEKISLNSGTNTNLYTVTSIDGYKFSVISDNNPIKHGVIRASESFIEERIDPQSTLIESIIKKEREGSFNLSFNSESDKASISIHVQERNIPISYLVSYNLKRLYT